MATPSDRIALAVAALPIRSGMRVLEIGCGPGVAARAVLERVGDTGFVLGIDRSSTAITQAERGSSAGISSGRLAFRTVAAEEFVLATDESLFDLAFALRVGALDGRHPDAGRMALAHIVAVLRPGGKLFVDTGNPMAEVPLPNCS
jgi:ubiquinone/menaquinone biosynthesis C-methylase UbiE